MSKLIISGARENNLKNISLEIEHDSLTVITGLSGSGKSSLAYKTVYAEGQRRYIETFSPYTRQFFDKVKKPDADSIENVRPAIAIQQKTRVTNSRSTVGTMTSINDYLKTLWSNIAKPLCPSCRVSVEAWHASSLAAHLTKLISASKAQTYFVCVPYRLSENSALHPAEIDRLVTLGYSRFLDFDSGSPKLIEESETPTLTENRELLLIVDRLKSSQLNEKRLRENISQAFSQPRSSIILVQADLTTKTWLEQYKTARAATCKTRGHEDLAEVAEFRNYFFCPASGIETPPPKPALFTFNHPSGACPECKGFGNILRVDPKLCVPNPSLSIEQGALQCLSVPAGKKQFSRLMKFCAEKKISVTKPWNTLSAKDLELIFTSQSKAYPGINLWFKRFERKIYKMHVRVFLSRYRSQFICDSCGGKRLRPEALAYEVNGKTISDLWDLPVSSLQQWLSEQLKVAKNLPREVDELFLSVLSRLSFLLKLGLSYLALGRASRTLSGGETQRVNLAAAIGSELVSTSFVLDEPSVGLHPRDSAQLIEALRSLQQKGNTLVVVEHDPDCMEAADNIIELGPGAGEAGGNLVYSGAQAKWSGIEISRKYSATVGRPNGPTIQIRGATIRNLKNLSVDIPVGLFNCLTGVSGSGKSTLVAEVIGKRLHAEIQGLEQFKQVLLVDQSGLAKSPRANIATYTGIWDSVRNLLSQTEQATIRGLTKSHFSFNVDRGRCPHCKGAGFIKEDMQFLSDVYIQCENCLGQRFQQKVLEVKYKGLNAHDFLTMTVERAAEFFATINSVSAAAKTLSLLGLGHVTLGHPLSELSGGEAQRLKLVPFVQKSDQGKALLIFDEPTTGLHPKDIERLIKLMRLLRDEGHTVLCVEHNLQLILASDWIIDLGPEGGAGGGALVLEGTPAEFIKTKKKSYTADFLKRFVAGDEKSVRKAAHKPFLASSTLQIHGAREHNLKNIDVTVPLNSIVALTGVSGSGKSTIAKDIIYAEGQRRYLDCLSPYARQFIKELKKPEIDSIENVKPTVCVYQHTFQPGAKSTLATMSEVNNFLRLLYAKIGTQFCPKHPDQAISPLSADEIATEIKQLKTTKVRVLAPIIKAKKGHHRAIFERALAAEITEVRADGVFGRPGFFAEGLSKTKPHSIEFVVGAFNPKNVSADLIRESITSALGLGDGTLIVESEKAEIIFSSERTCAICKTGFFKLDPEDLSFNSKRGACAECSGFGCKSCEWTRLAPVGRNVRLRQKNIHELSMLTPKELVQFLSGIKLREREENISKPILKELFTRADALIDLGLDYLALSRDCSTLSGGELQRLCLATAMGSPLTGTLYIFDEPSAGLHPNDNQHVLSKIVGLKNRGNSVVIIEHDTQSIKAAEQIIDVGPGGGRDGGKIVFSGSLQDFQKADTETARELRAGLQFNEQPANKQGSNIRLEVKQKNNLTNLKIEIPLHCLVTVAGVSGAGKSSLVHGALLAGLEEFPTKKWNSPGVEASSTEEIFRVVEVNQKPIGINSRSTPASYLGIWDEIRKVFAMTVEAKAQGWGPSFFSYNTGKGRCPSCLGRGEVTIEMNFLPDAKNICESCGGKRFSEEANVVRYLGLSISEALNLTFEEAKVAFANHRVIHQTLHQACELGLGYLTLGQSSTTLSGGESQRVKLVSELAANRKGHSLYVLDEPTTGLHRADVVRLSKILRKLVQMGHTVIVIEHDPDLIAQADQVIELGPGPGEKGGKILFQGPPTKLASVDTPWGKLLKQFAKI